MCSVHPLSAARRHPTVLRRAQRDALESSLREARQRAEQLQGEAQSARLARRALQGAPAAPASPHAPHKGPSRRLGRTARPPGGAPGPRAWILRPGLSGPCHHCGPRGVASPSLPPALARGWAWGQCAGPAPSAPAAPTLLSPPWAGLSRDTRPAACAAPSEGAAVTPHGRGPPREARAGSRARGPPANPGRARPFAVELEQRRGTWAAREAELERHVRRLQRQALGHREDLARLQREKVCFPGPPLPPCPRDRRPSGGPGGLGHQPAGRGAGPHGGGPQRRSSGRRVLGLSQGGQSPPHRRGQPGHWPAWPHWEGVAERSCVPARAVPWPQAPTGPA